MYNQYLVTSSEVRVFCPEVNGDINDLLINRATLAVEDTILRDTLGQEWSDEIISQKSGGTYTAANAYIVNNFLKLLVSLSVWQYLVMTLSLQLNSAGLRIKSSDHSIAAESKDLAFFRDFIENYMDRVRQTMKRYIDDNISLYPLWKNNKYHDKPAQNTWNFRIGKV